MLVIFIFNNFRASSNEIFIDDSRSEDNFVSKLTISSIVQIFPNQETSHDVVTVVASKNSPFIFSACL